LIAARVYSPPCAVVSFFFPALLIEGMFSWFTNLLVLGFFDVLMIGVRRHGEFYVADTPLPGPPVIYPGETFFSPLSIFLFLFENLNLSLKPACSCPSHRTTGAQMCLILHFQHDLRDPVFLRRLGVSVLLFDFCEGRVLLF